MQGSSVRPLTLAGLAGVVLVGAVAPLALVSLAGGSGSAGWLAIAGGAACASGLALGSTQRLLPALALAVIAATALAAAAATGRDDEVRELTFRAARAGQEERPSPAAQQVAASESAKARPTPRQFVRGYYAAIEAGRYEDAWSHLSAAAHEQSPGFEDWRAGYATTVSQRVEDLDTEPGGVVRYVLVAVDRTPCGTTTERRFAVRWRLVRTGETTTATSLSGVKLAGLDPIAAC